MASFSVHGLFWCTVLFVGAGVSASADSKTATCSGLSSYKLHLDTFWSKETFNRQYPTYRPHAQWSRLIGRTHNARYSLYTEGKLASDALKEFAEQGFSTVLDVEAQGTRGVFDSFIGPNIDAGNGSSSVKVLAHGDYTKLSFVVRMIPSPDWFIGVDSVDLCVDGHWVHGKTVDLQPLDAGTDRGFTFTSPNWPDEPRKPIYAMNSTYPNHPASSFYYPQLDKLPTIASVKLTKIDLTWEDVPEEKHEKKSEDASTDKVAGAAAAAAAAESKPSVIMAKSVEVRHVPALPQSRSVARTVVRQTYTGFNRTALLRNGRHPALRSDCQVTDWSDWSSCSKTCGFGVRVRTRSVIRRPRSGGSQCPYLREEQLCGGVRVCTN